MILNLASIHKLPLDNKHLCIICILMCLVQWNMHAEQFSYIKKENRKSFCRMDKMQWDQSTALWHSMSRN